METVKQSAIARGEGGGWINRQSTENFQGSGNTLYDITMMDMLLYSRPNPYNV